MLQVSQKLLHHTSTSFSSPLRHPTVSKIQVSAYTYIAGLRYNIYNARKFYYKNYVYM